MTKLYIDYTNLNNITKKAVKDNLKFQKDQLIDDLSQKAEYLQLELKNFKAYCFQRIEEYMKEVSSKYNINFSSKGNLNITNSDGNYRVCKNVQEYIVLDEKLQIAKLLIDKCLNKWSEGGSVELKKVVDLAFSVDKRGKLNIPRVLSLRKLDIEDKDWQQAMQAISDSIDTVNSKHFVRVYKKNYKNEWQSISLDIAKM